MTGNLPVILPRCCRLFHRVMRQRRAFLFVSNCYHPLPFCVLLGLVVDLVIHLILSSWSVGEMKRDSTCAIWDRSPSWGRMAM